MTTLYDLETLAHNARRLGVPAIVQQRPPAPPGIIYARYLGVLHDPDHLKSMYMRWLSLGVALANPDGIGAVAQRRVYIEFYQNGGIPGTFVAWIPMIRM